MPSDEQNKKKNILDLQFFKLKKKQESIHISNKNKILPPTKKFELECLEEDALEISTRIKNIKGSIQRINKLISELKQISNKPNK